MNLLFVLTAAFWGRRLCVYTEGREKVNGKNDFFEKKVDFLFGGWDGRHFGEEVDKLRGRGEWRRRCTS